MIYEYESFVSKAKINLLAVLQTLIFHWLNPFGRTMAEGSTQPVTELSIKNISWKVKAAGV
jgi:hypothetical protein